MRKAICLIWILSMIGCKNQTPTLSEFSHERQSTIHSLESTANCKGPGGLYRTYVYSDQKGNLIFTQDFDYKDSFSAKVDSTGQAYVLDSLGMANDSLSYAVREMMQSHAFHWIHLFPEFIIQDYKTDLIAHSSDDNQVHFNANDQMGNPLHLVFDNKTDLLSSFTLQNMFDTTELINCYYTNYRESRYGPMVQDVMIVQANRDTFNFEFTSVKINGESI